MLFIIHILSLVGVALGVAHLICLFLFPLSMTVFYASLKLPSVAASICPFILTEAFGLSINVLTNKDITICEEITAVAVS